MLLPLLLSKGWKNDEKKARREGGHISADKQVAAVLGIELCQFLYFAHHL